MDAVADSSSCARVPTFAPSSIREKYVRGMGRARISDVLGSGASLIGQEVTVAGWLKTVREAAAGAIAFLALNDGSCMGSLQCVIDKASCEGAESIARCGGTGASFRAIGKVVASEGKGQTIELAVSKLVLLGVVEEPLTYPLAKKKHT